MTALDPAVNPATVETAPAPVPASVRVYVLAAEKALVPMTLPAEAPLSMLVGPTVKTANVRLGLQGGGVLPDRTRYEFARVDGAVLSDKPAATLLSCGVKDGDLLRLVPAGQAVRFVPRIENLASALASYLRGLVKPVTPNTAHTVAVATIIAATLAAAAMVWRSRLAVESGGILAPAVLAVLAVLAWVATFATAKRWAEHWRYRDAFAADRRCAYRGMPGRGAAGIGGGERFRRCDHDRCGRVRDGRPHQSVLGRRDRAAVPGRPDHPVGRLVAVLAPVELSGRGGGSARPDDTDHPRPEVGADFGPCSAPAVSLPPRP